LFGILRGGIFKTTINWNELKQKEDKLKKFMLISEWCISVQMLMSIREVELKYVTSGNTLHVVACL
jgi:hypothetical protein